MSIKVGIISDTHGHLPAQVKTLFEGVEAVLHAGDLDNLKVMHALQRIAPLHVVRGNTDHFSGAEKLPLREVVTLGGVHIGMLHGDHYDQPELRHKEMVASFQGREIKALIHGHSHKPCLERVDGVLVCNPGSASRPRGDAPAGVGILTIDQGAVEIELIEL